SAHPSTYLKDTLRSSVYTITEVSFRHLVAETRKPGSISTMSSSLTPSASST
ncbi:hypothetical protein R1flu_010998, partial [Riccia fluitans]